MTDSLASLRDPQTIRLRARAITEAVADGRSPLFRLDRTQLDAAADRVAALTLQRFPDLNIPFHSRWRHFEAGGIDRKAELDAALAGREPAERARAMFDLTVVSVLLDAGAGSAWRYSEGGQDYARSEGLGVASFRAFMDGVFAVDSLEPLRADGSALARLGPEGLRRVFQVSASNPMVGLEGRAGLLARLGAALPRPGVLYDRLVAGGRTEVSASQVLGEVLRGLSPVWTSGSTVKGRPAGDVWPHKFAGNATADGPDVSTTGFVPFHKLSQWLTYSLIEPLQWAGVQVTGLDALTGLPEYRNGGLLIDCGVIVPREARLLERRWTPADELVIEWRALTVTLLTNWPNACARAWAAARPNCRWPASWKAAPGPPGGRSPRNGAPVAPRRLQIDSDGTVF